MNVKIQDLLGPEAYSTFYSKCYGFVSFILKLTDFLTTLQSLSLWSSLKHLERHISLSPMKRIRTRLGLKGSYVVH